MDHHVGPTRALNAPQFPFRSSFEKLALSHIIYSRAEHHSLDSKLATRGATKSWPRPAFELKKHGHIKQATCDSDPGCCFWCRLMCAMASADGAGLVSAGRAAILAKAPRRTAGAVAAAVVSAVVGTPAEAACQTQLSSERAGTQRGTARSKVLRLCWRH